jgi:hypothetical protein
LLYQRPNFQVNRWFIYVELNFLMQKAFHFHERPCLLVDARLRRLTAAKQG